MRQALILVLFTAGVANAQTRPDLRVAVTFDDVPGVHMTCRPGAALAMNQQLLAGLARHRIPAAALVVAGRGHCGATDLSRIVDAWIAGGHEIGSHTFTHRDVTQIPLRVYLADIDSAHVRLSAILRPHGKTLRFFRHPFLRVGDTPAKKEGLEAHLRKRGYQVAAVSVDNQEWVFAQAYATAKARGDKQTIDRILPAYYAHLDSSFAYYEGLSERIFKRQIAQILLLHANELNTDHLDDVVRIIRARGYRFVSMSAALSDSAYRRPDRYIGRAGMSWLQRWAIDAKIPFNPEPREPAWLQPR